MTKLILALESKWYKSSTSVYYFIDKEIRKLAITIVYIDNIYFIKFKRFPALLKIEVKIYDEMRIFVVATT